VFLHVFSLLKKREKVWLGLGSLQPYLPLTFGLRLWGDAQLPGISHLIP